MIDYCSGFKGLLYIKYIHHKNHQKKDKKSCFWFVEKVDMTKIGIIKMKKIMVHRCRHVDIIIFVNILQNLQKFSIIIYSTKYKSINYQLVHITLGVLVYRIGCT